MADFRVVSVSCGYFFSGRPRTKKPHETDSLVFFSRDTGPQNGSGKCLFLVPRSKKQIEIGVYGLGRQL